MARLYLRRRLCAGHCSQRRGNRVSRLRKSWGSGWAGRDRARCRSMHKTARWPCCLNGRKTCMRSVGCGKTIPVGARRRGSPNWRQSTVRAVARCSGGISRPACAKLTTNREWVCTWGPAARCQSDWGERSAGQPRLPMVSKSLRTFRVWFKLGLAEMELPPVTIRGPAFCRRGRRHNTHGAVPWSLWRLFRAQP